MSLSRTLLLLALVALGPDLDSRCQVRLDRGRVLISAKAAALEEVLTRFSQVTGAKIVYGTERPRQLVSVEIDAPSEAEALAQLLEGQELGYALRLDKSGKQVETVLLTAKGGMDAPPPGASEEPTAGLEPIESEAEQAGLEEATLPADESEEPGREGSPAPYPLLPALAPSAPDRGVTLAPAAPADTTGSGGEVATPESPRPASPAAPGVGTPWLPAPASYPVPASYPAPVPVVIPPRN